MISTLILDMDGLMIDSEGMYWAAAREVAAAFGTSVGEDTLGDMMGRSPVESMAVFRRDLKIESASAEELLAMRTERVIRLLGDAEPMPGLIELLDAFIGRLRYAICTSAPMAFVDVVMRRLDLRRRFAHVQTSDGIARGKPDPEIYRATMAALGARPDECVVLEDASNGALAAKRAGAYVIAVPSRYTAGQDFSFVDFQAGNLADAQRHIAGLGCAR